MVDVFLEKIKEIENKENNIKDKKHINKKKKKKYYK